MSVGERGGPQLIPRPADARPGQPAPWAALPPGERAVDLARVRSALAGPRQPQPAETEGQGSRASAVLAPLFEEDGRAWVVLTRRARHLRAHRGEVSFPGGARDGDEPLTTTALREANEEIGLDPASVEIIGELDHLHTVSSQSFIVPYVGLLSGRPSALRANAAEVDRILYVPLSELLLDEVYHEEVWPIFGQERAIHFFDLVGDTIWGATARMLRHLLALTLGVPDD